jgi:DNA modification methylase
MKPYYSEDGIVIYNGDCREVLPTLETFDLCLTDPPYGIGESNRSDFGKAAKGRHARGSYIKSQWDKTPPSDELIRSVVNSARKAIVWGGNYFHVEPSSAWLVWDKDNGGSDFADCELAWTNLDQAVRKIKHRWNGMLQEFAGADKEERFHPTQKPVRVMKWAAQFCLGSIIDPFMGSGTTLVAAKQLGRKATGIELEERYCEVAAKRLRQGVLPLFG